MPSYRVPLLIYRDASGLYSALPVEPVTDLVGTGKTAPDAIKQVKEYLAWSYANDDTQMIPEFEKPTLKKLTVRVRPAYESESRRFPLDNRFELPCHCLLAEREDGLRTCSIPLLNIRFDYYEDDSLEQLVKEAVRSSFTNLPPRALSRYLPPEELWLEQISVRVKPKRFRGLEAAHVPNLEQVADPIGKRTALKQHSRAYLRDGDVETLVERLIVERASVILVGEPGVGKTTVLVEAVREAERRLKQQQKEESDDDEDTPEQHSRYRFWQTNASRIIAGMQYLGEWEARCEALIHELSEIRGVLCLERLHDLLQVGGREATDSVAAFLLPYLQQQEIRLVAEATPDELAACDRLLPGFTDLFRKMPIEAFDADQTTTVLDRVIEGPAKRHGIPVEGPVSTSVCRLHRRFVPYRSFPGPAVRFIDGLLDRIVQQRKENTASGKQSILNPDAVRDEFARITGLPELFLRDDLPLETGEVRRTLNAQVIGQERACESVMYTVTTFKAGVNDPKRPLGVLLFVGPTGVGKTELAKALARFCFPGGEQSDHFFRLDMSEYLGPGSADRLIIAPDGRPSSLIRHVRQHPFSVVLFDEIEKADPEVFDVLLNVFEEGRLTDAFGRTTHFQSTILIMTSNVGAAQAPPVGFLPDRAGDELHAVERFFRPEFVNRIDEVIPFAPLDETIIGQITRKELKALEEREGLAEAKLTLTFSEPLIEAVIDTGFDADYGARPLKRAIETLVVTPISRYLVTHPDTKNRTLLVTLDDDGAVVVQQV